MNTTRVFEKRKIAVGMSNDFRGDPSSNKNIAPLRGEKFSQGIGEIEPLDNAE